MSPPWGAVNARARGLAVHLLSRRQLAALSGAPDLRTLADRLRTLGFVPAAGAEPSPADLELGVRRRAAAHLATLARWTGGRVEIAAVLYDGEDRRSVRAALRGALQRAPVEARLAGLIPTPALPERALAALARTPTPAAAAALLVAWRHHLGPPLVTATQSAAPDPFHLELALNRATAARLVAAGRRAGGQLAAYVRETIDLENALAAVALAGAPHDVFPRDVFLLGGRVLSVERFALAVATGDPPAAAAEVAVPFGRSPLGAALRRDASAPAALADAVLRARIAGLRAAGRRDPLGPAPLLAFGLALRAQTMDLHRIVWGVALGAPAPLLTRALVTAA